MPQTQTDSERKRLQRERTRKHREKVKERAANDATAAEQRKKDEFDAWRKKERLVFPGEIEAFENAETVEDALQVAREFLVALNQPDIFAGECLLDGEKRVVESWCAAGAPLLNRDTLRLDTSVASTEPYTFNFDNRWAALDGANELIDVSTLPVIVVPELVSPAVDTDTPITVEHWRLPAYAPTLEEQLAMEHRHQTGLCRVSPQEALMLKTQQDAMDAKAREISASNEARELANERRLGTYAYDANLRNSR
jgi:hypothetical protein